MDQETNKRNEAIERKFKDGDKVRVISSLLPLKGRMQVISAEYIFNERWYYRLAFLTQKGAVNKLKKHKFYVERDLVIIA